MEWKMSNKKIILLVLFWAISFAPLLCVCGMTGSFMRELHEVILANTDCNSGEWCSFEYRVGETGILFACILFLTGKVSEWHNKVAEYLVKQ